MRLQNEISKTSTEVQDAIEGLPCFEIATRLQKSAGAIRTKLSRTLNTLRDIYGKKEEGTSRE